MKISIIIGSVLVLGSIYLIHFVFILKDKQRQLELELNRILLLMQDRLDKLPLLMELFKSLNPENINELKKLNHLRQTMMAKRNSSVESKKANQEISELIKSLLIKGNGNPKLSKNLSYLALEQDLVDISKDTKKKINSYNLKVKRYELLRKTFFLGEFFKIKKVKPY